MTRLITIIAGGLVVGAVVIVAIFLGASDAARAELAIELAKAAIALIPAVFLGVIVSEVIKRRDEERAPQEKQRDERRAFRDRAIAAYNQSKSVRRYLRGAGFGPRVPARLTSAMLTALDDQMHALCQAQLLFEQLNREAKTTGAPFAARDAVSIPLGKIEGYLNEAIKEWEHGRAQLDADPDAQHLRGWAYFSDFVADKDGPHLDDNPTAAFKELEGVVLGELRVDAVIAPS